MRVLVCGGAGYIGSHMCKLLAAHGHPLAVIDNLSTGHAAALRWGQFHAGDIGDAALLERVMGEFRPEAVMHFAGRSIVPDSVADPLSYYRNNVAAAISLLDRVRHHGCVFIFSSSASVYGIPQTDLIDASHPAAPVSPYGRSKLMVERLLRDCWQAYGLPSVSLRYFNAAGADESGEIGEAHSPETHLIPIALETALGHRGPVNIHGDDFRTPDGTCVRDYIHVNDLCQAHLDSLAWIGNHRGAHVFNLGNGTGFSVREVIDTAARITGVPIPVSITARRPGDPDRLVADATDARLQLGWSPARPALEQIIETAWNWHRRQPS